HLCRELPFVAGLVRQHGLADDVADGIDVRHVGAHLPIYRDIPALVDQHAGGFRTDALAVGPTTYGQQHTIVDLRLRCAVAFEGGLETFLRRLDLGDLGLEINALVALLDALVQRPDDVAIGAGYQTIEQLHYGNLRAERVVDG